MKNLYLVFIALLMSTALTAQVVSQRISDLQPANYTIAGDAFLEELSNGDLQLRLSDDFDTPTGPDVRIFLSNSTSPSGALEIVNLSTIGHFNGGLTLPVPAGVGINDYDFIVFFCFAFNQLWATGEFGPASGGGGPTCDPSSVLNAGGPSFINICPSDNNSDVVQFTNTLGLSAGPEYVYLITDNNDILQEVVMVDQYDFEGSTPDLQRVYGMNYSGNLSPLIGADRMFTTADGCFEHSSSSSFVLVSKDACITCNESTVNIVGGTDNMDLCPSDGNSDVIEFENSLNLDAGDRYVYLLTDENEILQEVIDADEYDFEGSTTDAQRVYGLHFDGTLNEALGQDRLSTTASGCFEHSAATDFISVSKNACFACEVSTVSNAGGNNTIDICPSDNGDDIVQLSNSLGLAAGNNYMYLLTDANEILQEVISADSYNFEGTNTDEQRIYGLHFDGVLDAVIGSDRSATTASGCFEHSADTDFVSVTKNACFVCEESTVSNAGGNNAIDICPSDNNADAVSLQNSLGLTAGNNYVYLLTDANEILQEVIITNFYNFEGSNADEQRVYGLHFDGVLDAMIGSNRSATTASGCFEHSSGTDFISVTKNACFVCEESTVSNAGGNNAIDICPSDNGDDTVSLSNSLGLVTGVNYVYLLTDANEILQEVISTDSYNFEGSNSDEQRIYGMHFDGVLDAMIGSNRSATTASGCFEHSSDADFISVTKNACFVCEENTVSNASGNNTIDICPSDNGDDVVQLSNSLGLSAGTNYVYLLTDANEILQEVINADSYNFEGTNFGEQRIYGMHFDGALNAAVGFERIFTTASGCFEHSGDSEFISVTKNACFVCEMSTVSNASGSNSINICPTDNNDDLVSLSNSLGLAAGTNYVYLLTDENEILQEVINANSYNFEGSPTTTQRIYGLHFDGTLSPAIGANRLSTTASGCFEHSDAQTFIAVGKNACFDCNISTVSNANGTNAIAICPTDNDSDLISFVNSLGLSAGNEYVYLLTDENQILQEVIDADQFDFEGSSTNTQRVYGMHFDGTLEAQIGANRQLTSASGCFEHSDENTFISVSKTACVTCDNSTVSSTGQNSFDICPTDGNSDLIPLTNSLGLSAGDNYIYLLTDENEILQEVIDVDAFDFEGSSLTTQRVYGMHFDGVLNIALGENRTATTASRCFEHSSTNEFLSISKNACFNCLENTVSNANGNNTLDICPTDGSSDIIALENSLGLAAGDNYVYLLTDDNEILIEVINDDQFNFEGSNQAAQRIYGMHFDGALNTAIGLNRLATSVDGCFEHSGSNDFIRVSKNACFDCLDNSVQNASGSNAINICPTDSSDDIIALDNSLGLSAGTNYVYLLTDENEILQEVISEDEFNFEGSSVSTQRIYGMHFDGNLNAAIGENRMATTADECFAHSSAADFISIAKTACFDCNENTVGISNGSNEVDICPTDTEIDIVPLENSLGLNAGDNYVYLLTDENEILIEVISEDSYDFDGASLNPQRVYGLHFDGDLAIAIGEDRMQTTADGCFAHSSDFINVTKNACFRCEDSNVSLLGGATQIDICPTDNDDNILTFQNSIGLSAGAHYVYLITDENEILQEVISENEFNFEGSSLNAQRVYGLHFDGVLTAALGEDRMETTANGCFAHSSDTDFISITKEACEEPFVCELSFTATDDWAESIDICPGDGAADIVPIRNNLFVEAGANYAYLLTDANEILQEVILSETYDFEGSSTAEQRIYGIHYDGVLSSAIGENRLMTTASGCFEHSGADIFLTITKNACTSDFECMTSLTATTDWVTEADICPNDGVDDFIELRNTLFIPAGDHYAYLLTDVNGILQEVVLDTFYNFEGSSLETQLAYGIHFDGTLNPVIGADRLETTATGCFEHSGADLFLTISKNACTNDFECMTSLTATTDWVTEADICPNDGVDDFIELRNTLFIPAGDHYAYLLTDVNGILQEVVLDTFYNFEGSSFETQLVYGIHFDGTLNPAIGENRLETTATGCFEHSGADLFLTIGKSLCESDLECQESLTATHNWVTEIDVCANDGDADWVFLQNNINTPPGENYAFLLTDENEILQEVILDTIYNFEDTDLDEQRVYGISYVGSLEAAIGEDRKNTTASDCFIHSGDDLFIRINKSAACETTATQDLALLNSIDVFPNPSSGLVHINMDNASVTFTAVSLFDIHGQFIKDLSNQNSFNVETAGVYLLRFSNGRDTVTKRVVIQK